jgi:predicted small secreted protein
MKKISAASAALLAAAMALAPIACSNTVEGVKKDVKENKVEERAEKAVETVAHAVKEAGHEIREHALALEIKAALVADKSVEAGGISVDADDDTRTVTLKGSVPTAAQRATAEATARKKAKGYRVRNLLIAG